MRDDKKHTTAVLLAAGSGSRMASDLAKQFMTICGLPVAIHSLLALEKAKLVDEIVIVTRAGDTDDAVFYEDFLLECGITKVTAICPGGATRQESALCGLAQVSESTTHIAFHDAARCLVTSEMVDSVIAQAHENGCASAATKATDTIKLVGRDGVTLTSGQPLRENCYVMQTPQVFALDIYKNGAEWALAEGYFATDDCALVEAMGIGVTLVDCGRENIKITEPTDILLAEAILGIRGGGK